MPLPDATVWVAGSAKNMVGKKDIAERHDRKVDGARARASVDGWKGFVNVDLTTEQKKAVQASAALIDKHWGTIFDLVDGGYKLSLTYDKANGAYVVSMTCKQSGDVNNGLTLTARGGALQGAVCCFVYKHSVVLEGDWTSVGVAGSRQFSEDDVG